MHFRAVDIVLQNCNALSVVGLAVLALNVVPYGATCFPLQGLASSQWLSEGTAEQLLHILMCLTFGFRSSIGHQSTCFARFAFL
jgi:hypothetical protein